MIDLVVIMIDKLRIVLQNDRIEEIDEIKNNCRNLIVEKSSIKRPTFEIRSDPFYEGNNGTERLC